MVLLVLHEDDGNNNNESGDNTGDVLNNDTDADGDDTYCFSYIRRICWSWSATGTYGTLTIQS